MNQTTTKTTIYLDAEVYRRLKQLAREQERPTAELIREAVAEYARRHVHRRWPTSIGTGASGLGDLGERSEAYLEGFGEE
jgi:predicted transcriptional regulator